MAKNTAQELKPIKSGKVRDIFDAGDNLVIVASDRISAFDAILPTPIPGKGKILTDLSVFWFGLTEPIVDHHLITTRLRDFPEPFNRQLDWKGRAMLVRRTKVVTVECVVRGYLTGSGWKDYQKDGTISGISLPPGLRESEKLPEPIFTPSTKADVGHDEPINFNQVAQITGLERALRLREVSLALYNFAANYALERKIIIADTKFEFGITDDGELILVDEILTPDSSRFWDVEKYEPGRSQDSFDKQFVRNYLETLGWDKNPPAPDLPPHIAEITAVKYVEAYNRITGLTWPDTTGIC